MHWIYGWTGDLSLSQRTGDGNFDGETFWVGCGCFFLGGTGKGKRRLQDRFSMIGFFAGRRESPNRPFYVIVVVRLFIGTQKTD